MAQIPLAWARGRSWPTGAAGPPTVDRRVTLPGQSDRPGGCRDRRGGTPADFRKRGPRTELVTGRAAHHLQRPGRGDRSHLRDGRHWRERSSPDLEPVLRSISGLDAGRSADHVPSLPEQRNPWRAPGVAPHGSAGRDGGPMDGGQLGTRRSPHLATTSLSSSALARAPQQHLDQRADRAPAVRDALFGRQGRLGERQLEIEGEEQRVVPEAAGATRLDEHAPLARRLDELRLRERGLEIGDDAAIARGALRVGYARQALEQQRVVRRIAGAGAVHLRPARREHAGRAFQRVDLQPRVFRERRDVAALGEVARFGDRVLREAGAALEIAFVRQPLEKLVDREGQLKRQTLEQVTDLADLAVVTGGDQELSRRCGRRRHRAAPPRSRASSSVVDTPATSGTRTTRAPQASTWSAPTIASRP